MRPLNELKFSWQDYVVFAVSLTAPLAIGIFFFFYKRRQQSTDSFLLGDRSLNVVAVGMSLIASILNGIFIVGLPAEMHYHGTEMTYMLVASIVVTVLGAHVFIPRYRHLRSTSAYEVLFDLTLWRPLLPYGYSYEAIICNFWHPGTLTLRAERQSARMSKITNDGKWRLDPVWHRKLYSCIHMATVGVKGLRPVRTSRTHGPYVQPCVRLVRTGLYQWFCAVTIL